MFFHRCALALALAAALALSACGATATPTAIPPTAPTSVPAASASAAAPTAAATAAPAAPAAMTITDVSGRSVTIAAPPQRIVALAPSDTEILFALGLGPKVLAVDDFTDYPPEAKKLPKIGGLNGSYNFEQIVALKPDLVLAAGISPPEAVQKLADLKLTVVVLGTPQTTLDSVFADIALAGKITGQTEQAERVAAALRQELDAVEAKVATATTRPRVYWELDATDPTKPFSVGPGNFVGDLIAMAGGTNIFASAGSPFPQISAEQVVAADPEVIIMSDAAYGITVESLAQRPGWQAIAAVKDQRVSPIDDNLVSRPGPRIVDGLEATARIIHPELFK